MTTVSPEPDPSLLALLDVDPAELDFERAAAALDQLAKRMEQDDLPLELSVRCYAAGVKLAARCRELLDAAERTVTQLMDDGSEVPFDDR
ncbi:MAG: exodeoxyribonuclease VII small subunit [Candidatus Dadabacteria bacterium]|nr:MAG: exodeoxyribonuclease VII small subunit [Candidatus Dadabacteria bacterium]